MVSDVDCATNGMYTGAITEIWLESHGGVDMKPFRYMQRQTHFYGLMPESLGKDGT